MDGAAKKADPKHSSAFVPIEKMFELEPDENGVLQSQSHISLADRIRHEWVFMKTVVDQLPVGVLIIEVDTEKVLLRNRQFDRMTALPPIVTFKEYEQYYSALHTDGTPYGHDECPIIRAIKNDETVNDEPMMFRHESGAQLVLSVNAAPILDKHGELCAGVAIYGDITQRALIETHVEFLAEAGAILAKPVAAQVMYQELTELAIAHIADGCTIDLLGDDNKVVLSASSYKDPKQKELAMGVRDENYLDLKSAYGVGAVLRTGRAALYHDIRPGVVERIAGGYTHAKGMIDMGLISAMIVPLTRGGNVIGAMTFVSMSEGNLFDKDSLRLAEELAKRISLAMENSRLYRDAQKAIKLRDDFINMASHELKTPLTSMTILAESLREHCKDMHSNGVHEDIVQLNREIDRLTKLIDRLLDISQIRKGKLEYRKETFDLALLAQDIVSRARRTSKDRVITLVCGSPVLLFADKEGIGQVLMNLLTNALKFSSGEIIVEIKETSGGASMKVSDLGIGIPKDIQKKIFEQFYQGVGASRKTYPGLGMGLYIVAEILKEHEGTITVESEEGHGAVFAVTLPLVKENNKS